MTGFSRLVEVLAGWPHSQIPIEKFGDSCHERLRQTLLSLHSNNKSVVSQRSRRACGETRKRQTKPAMPKETSKTGSVLE